MEVDGCIYDAVKPADVRYHNGGVYSAVAHHSDGFLHIVNVAARSADDMR